VIAAATAGSKDPTSIGALLNQVHGAPTRHVDVDCELGIHRLDVDAEDFLDDPEDKSAPVCQNWPIKRRRRARQDHVGLSFCVWDAEPIECHGSAGRARDSG